MDVRQAFLNKAAQRKSGCPLFEGREKGDLDELTGSIVSLDQAYPMEGENGRYYVVTFKEDKDSFFMSCQSLTELLNDAQAIADEAGCSINTVIDDICIRFGELTKTKTGRRFRPVEVVEG